MKVLMISTDRKIFEEGSAVQARMIEYAALFDELHIVVFSKRGQLTTYNLQLTTNCWVYPTSSLTRWFYIFDAVRIGKRIIHNSKFIIPARLQPDKVILAGTGVVQSGRHNSVLTSQDPFECGLAAYKISQWAKIPLHLQIHADFLSPYFKSLSFLNMIRVRIAKFILPKANGIRVVSKRIADSLKTKNYKLKTSPVILPIFTDLKKFTDGPPSFNLKQKYPQWHFIILVAARFAPEKNISFALKVFRELLNKYPKIGLVVVGNGPLKKNYKLQTTNYKLRDNVAFEDWQEDLVSYYKTADLFLSASLYEGFGLALLEAVASGCPSISSDAGIAPELLRFKGKSFICPVNDLECFVGKVSEFIENNQLRQFFHFELAPAVIARFDLSKEEYLKKYKESLEPPVM